MTGLWKDGSDTQSRLAEEYVVNMLASISSYPFSAFTPSSAGLQSMGYLARQRILTLEKVNRSLRNLIR